MRTITTLKPKDKIKYASNRHLTDKDVKEVRKLFQKGYSKTKLSRMYGIVPSAITYILIGQSYSWVV